MEYVVGAVALGIILFLLSGGRDSRAATIKALPTYGSAEAARLQEEISRQGPARLVSSTADTSSWVAIEPARSEAYFRERIVRDGRRPTTPSARLRRARSKPARPKPLVAPKPRPGNAPAQTILVPASHCRICGRLLTNAESRRRGVGPDCYRNYGARLVHVPNPAFAEWSDRKTLMEAQQAAWQALLDELYLHLMRRFESEMRNWNEAGRSAS
jgi:hypothetical protein